MAPNRTKSALLATSSPRKKKGRTTGRIKVGSLKCKNLKSRRGVTPVRQAVKPHERLMTVNELCAYAHITRSTVYRYLACGMKAYQYGHRGARRFLIDDVIRYLSGNKSVAKAVMR